VTIQFEPDEPFIDMLDPDYVDNFVLDDATVFSRLILIEIDMKCEVAKRALGVINEFKDQKHGHSGIDLAAITKELTTDSEWSLYKFIVSSITPNTFFSRCFSTGVEVWHGDSLCH
jgi:hypothetical protein